MSLFNPSPCPLVAILRGLTPAEAPAIGRVLFETGFRMVEVPLNRPGAMEAMQAIIRIAPEDALVGAGTVMTVQQAEAVRKAGGRLIVSPHCAHGVIAYAAQNEMIAMPGIVTPTEAFQALDAGAAGLKLFPAEMIPPEAVKSIRSVIPHDIPLFPVGGVRPQSMAAYVDAGASGFGIGGQLFKPGMDEEAVRRAADAFMSARAALLPAGK
jgi:2-dehydro-3-deoxyphosphogalactonate aldolase